ncbi:MAG TPA: hypothetical protein VIL25_08445 [Vicinamibacterales bacterium]
MHGLDALLSDLEWRRLRRRVSRHPAEAMFLNCWTWLRIMVLRSISR